jgi:hypothetical protein
MRKKECRNCHEINSGSAMICSNCNSTLSDAIIKEDIYTRTKENAQHTGIGPDNNVIYASGDAVISLGMWIVVLILLAIPIVNIITLFYLSFGGENDSLSNFCRASLILGGIGLVLIFLLKGCS